MKAKVIRSSTWRAPSSATSIWTSASVRVKDCAPALARRKERSQRERCRRGPETRQKRTCGASRAGSSISKYGFSAKLNMPATMFVGTVSSAVS